MTLEDAFLADIIENPDDDGVRLIYADWLDDHGEPERAEFIRVQCELASMPEADPRWKELERRERALLEEHQQRWVGRVGDWVAGWCFRRGLLAVTINAPALLAISPKPGEDDWFRRGMVLEMHVLGAAGHIDALVRSPHLARLTSLSLSDNRIGDVHVMALAASPHLSSPPPSAGLAQPERDHLQRGGAACLGGPLRRPRSLLI